MTLQVAQNSDQTYFECQYNNGSGGLPQWVAQTFTPENTFELTSAVLKLGRRGSPGTVSVSFYTTDGNGHPDAFIRSSSFNGNVLNGATEYGTDGVDSATATSITSASWKGVYPVDDALNGFRIHVYTNGGAKIEFARITDYDGSTGTIHFADGLSEGGTPAAFETFEVFDSNGADKTVTFSAGTTFTSGVMYAMRVSGGDLPHQLVTWDRSLTSVYDGGSREQSTDGGSTWNSISDDLWFELYGDTAVPSKATNPSPADSATSIDFSALGLSWDDGGGADTFDVYMGPSGDLSLISLAQAETTFTVNTIDVPWGETIYWRVDSTNAGGTITGDIWSFDIVIIRSVKLGANGAFIVVAAEDGVYLSTDSGANWSRKTPDDIEDTDWTKGICSSDGTYIIVVSSADAIYRSANSGTSWAEITPAGGDTFFVNEMATSDDGQFMVIVGQNTTDATESCYISSDYGATWTIKKPDTQLETYTTGDSGEYTIQKQTERHGQTFKHKVGFSLTSLKLKLWKEGSPGTNLKVSIFETTGTPPKPIGSALVTVNVPTSNITKTNAPGFWYTVEISLADLSANTDYAIVLSPDEADWGDGNSIKWREDSAPANYNNGYGVAEFNGIWDTYTFDHMFEVWGDKTVSTTWNECDITNDGEVIGVSTTGDFYISLDSGATWKEQGMASSAEVWEHFSISGDGTIGLISNTNNNDEFFIGINTELYSEATWAESALTSAGRALLDDATAADQATTLGLGTEDSPTFTGLTLSSIAAEGSDVDKFLVDSMGVIKYRTGAEVLSDIGAAASAHLHDTQTLQHDGVNSDGGAFPFNTTGPVSFNQLLASPGITVGNTGLHVLDTNASHDLIIAPGSDLTADRTFSIVTGDADRTLTMTGDAILNQDVTTTGTPTFAQVTVDQITINNNTINGNGNSVNITDGQDIIITALTDVFITGTAQLKLYGGDVFINATADDFRADAFDAIVFTCNGLVNIAEGCSVLSLESDGAINIKPSGDLNDYFIFSTPADVPTISTGGICNLTIAPDGGTTNITGILAVSSTVTWDGGGSAATNAHIVSDGSDHGFINQDVTTIGTPTFAELTVDNININGSNILSTADLNFYSMTNIGFTTTGGGCTFLTRDAINFQPNGDATDYLLIDTAADQTTIRFVGQHGRYVADGGTHNFTDDHILTTGNIDCQELQALGFVAFGEFGNVLGDRIADFDADVGGGVTNNYGFVSTPRYSGAETVDLAGFFARADVAATKSARTTRAGWFLQPYLYVTGTVQNAIGIEIGDVNLGTASNFSLKTGLGLVQFGGNVRLMNAFYIKERASAEVDSAGFGQIWTKDNAGTTELWFTDDNGTDHQVAYV